MSQARAAIRHLAAVPFRLLPPTARRRLVQALFTAEASRAPASAAAALLQMDEDLAVQINQVGVELGGGVHVKHRLMRYHDFFVDRIRPGERVLDVGCGYGAVAYSIASRAGAAVTGIDWSQAAIEQARRQFRHEALTFVAGNALTDLPDRQFDIVVLSNVLEHIEQRVDFLQQLQRRLRPRAMLIRVPAVDRDWKVALREELGMFYFSDGTHFTEYTEESFREEMDEAGLSVQSLLVRWGEIWAEARPA